MKLNEVFTFNDVEKGKLKFRKFFLFDLILSFYTD